MRHDPSSLIFGLLLSALFALAGCTPSSNPVDAAGVLTDSPVLQLERADLERAAAAKADRPSPTLGKSGGVAVYTFDDLTPACVWNREFPETYHDLAFSGSRFLASCALDGDLGLVPVNSKEQNNRTQTNIRLTHPASEVSISYFGYRFQQRDRIFVAYDEAGNEIDRASGPSDGSWHWLTVAGSIREIAIIDYQSQTVWDDLTVALETSNAAPIARAGADQTVIASETVTLDASSADDPDGDPLSYAWAWTSTAYGSWAAFSDPNGAVTTFVADMPGTYIARLVVHDGIVDSAPDEVEIHALSIRDAVSILDDDVADLTAAGELNRGQGNSLRKMLGYVHENAEQQPRAAFNKLNAFSRHVTALVKGGVLSADGGEALLDYAARIAGALASSGHS